MEVNSKHLLLTALLISSSFLSFEAFAQSNPADLPPAQKQKYKSTTCKPCEKYVKRYNKLVDKMYDDQVELREIGISIYEDHQFIEKDKANIDAIRAKGGPNAQSALETAYKVLSNDEADLARHEQESDNVDRDIVSVSSQEDIASEQLARCEKEKCGIEPKTSMVMPGSSTSTLGPQYAMSGFYGSAGLNYQQFSNNGSTYTESSTSHNYNVNTDYHSGFNLEMGYHFGGTRNSNLQIDYTHLHTSDNSNASASSLTVSPDSSGPVNSASSALTFNYNNVYFTAGHAIPMTNNFVLYLYGGVNYMQLSRNMDITGDGLGNSIFNKVGTNFSGWGPTFGMDGYCEPFDEYPNFSVFGGVQPSLLYGTMSGFVHKRINTTYTEEIIPNENLVVPGLGGKLGVNYDIPYKDVKFKLQVGYQLTEYFNIARDANYNNPINSSLQGPFVNFGVGVR